MYDIFTGRKRGEQVRITLTTEQRREEILYILHMRGHETIPNLAKELEVSIRTIKYDIEALADRCKVKTKRGKYGGVELDSGYFVIHLAPAQLNLLEELKLGLNGHKLEVMESIIADFSAP